MPFLLLLAGCLEIGAPVTAYGCKEDNDNAPTGVTGKPRETLYCEKSLFTTETCSTYSYHDDSAESAKYGVKFHGKNYHCWTIGEPRHSPESRTTGTSSNVDAG